MYIKNNTAKMIYRAIFLILCEAGIVLQYACVMNNGIVAVRTLTCYYTILSNIVCFIYFGYLAIKKPKVEKPVIKGAVTMCILLTCIVYHLLLSGNMESVGSSVVMNVANQLLHTVIPLMVFFDYLLFTPKGTFKSFDPLLWTLVPITYLFFILIRANVSPLRFVGFGTTPSRYPYPFMDFDLLGNGKATAMIFIIAISYIALGYILYVIDRLLSRKR